MKGRVAFIVGAAVGYVLGSRAGREHYDKLKEQAKALWENPSVQEKVTAAEDRIGDAMREQGAYVAEKITDTVKDTFSSGSEDQGVQPPDEPYPPPPRRAGCPASAAPAGPRRRRMLAGNDMGVRAPRLRLPGARVPRAGLDHVPQGAQFGAGDPQAVSGFDEGLLHRVGTVEPVVRG